MTKIFETTREEQPETYIPAPFQYNVDRVVGQGSFGVVF